MASIEFQIEILSVSAPAFNKTARGGYNSIEVAYKKFDRDGKAKVEGKKFVDFADKDLYTFLLTLTQGTKVDVTAEKGENDQFWKWARAEISSGGAVDSSRAADSGPNQSTGNPAPTERPNAGTTEPARGRVTGSNYETSDERKLRRDFDQLKHRQIGRQGCINAALSYFEVTKTKPANTEEVLTVAKQLENWVFNSDASIPF